MKIVHYIPSIDRESGGIGSYMQLLSGALGQIVELHIVTHHTDYELKLKDCHLHYIDRWIHYCKMKKQWNQLLNDIKPDVVNVNCCWEPECSIIQRWSSNKGYKTVYTPHGMLEPWILQRNYWTRKVPALLLYQESAIKRADAIHATAESERQNLLKLGYNKNVIVIPNGIDVSEIKIKNSWKKTKTLLFLSRIHIKKGIDLLINAVAELKKEMNGYQVLIAGEGDANYIAELKHLAEQKRVDNIVKFIGGVYGDAKWDLYHKADLFVLPTHSENFGIVVAEALACGTPVITTVGAPWEELNTWNCGFWVECSQIAITNAIREALNATNEELQVMGENGRRLMEERYSVEAIAEKMKDLYEWILGCGDKPAYVYDIQR